MNCQSFPINLASHEGKFLFFTLLKSITEVFLLYLLRLRLSMAIFHLVSQTNLDPCSGICQNSLMSDSLHKSIKWWFKFLMLFSSFFNYVSSVFIVSFQGLNSSLLCLFVIGVYNEITMGGGGYSVPIKISIILRNWCALISTWIYLGLGYSVLNSITI